ncbi:MAG: glycine cleavage system protein GcvH [Tissierellia bacterium]|nr:glycine cleavage system protein GcvH [Tissierellia bacterium]
MNIDKNLFYTEDHEWVKKEDDYAYIGIADYAQDSLGDIVYVELPDEEDNFEAEESVASVESVKAASEVFTPFSGTVVEVNEDLDDDPGILNEKPYEAWIVKMKVDDPAELDKLMSAEEYENFLKEE